MNPHSSWPSDVTETPPMSKMAPEDSHRNQDHITVLVGPDEHHFVLEPDIYDEVRFFSIALKFGGSETTRREVKLPADDPKIFQLVVAAVPTQQWNMGTVLDEATWLECFQVWVLADKLCAENLARKIDIYIYERHAEAIAGSDKMPHPGPRCGIGNVAPQSLHYLYENTLPIAWIRHTVVNSFLELLFVDHFVERLDEYPSQFVGEVMQAMVKRPGGAQRHDRNVKQSKWKEIKHDVICDNELCPNDRRIGWTRYQCKECLSINLCEECKDKEVEGHTRGHALHEDHEGNSSIPSWACIKSEGEGPCGDLSGHSGGWLCGTCYSKPPFEEELDSDERTR